MGTDQLSVWLLGALTSVLLVVINWQMSQLIERIGKLEAAVSKSAEQYTAVVTRVAMLETLMQILMQQKYDFKGP